MITVDDIKRAALVNTASEWDDQCKLLASLASISMENYRKVLTVLKDAKEELPDVDWVQSRLTKARDSAVDGWAYR